MVPKRWPDGLGWSTKRRPPRVKLKGGGHPRVKWRASPVGRGIASKGVESMDWSSHTTPSLHPNLLRNRRGTGGRSVGDRSVEHRRIARRCPLGLRRIARRWPLDLGGVSRRWPLGWVLDQNCRRHRSLWPHRVKNRLPGRRVWSGTISGMTNLSVGGEHRRNVRCPLLLAEP